MWMWPVTTRYQEAGSRLFGQSTAHSRPCEASGRRRLVLEQVGVASSQKNGSEPAAIVLHAGEHFLNATIELNAKDSGLTIMLRVLARRAT